MHKTRCACGLRDVEAMDSEASLLHHFKDAGLVLHICFPGCHWGQACVCSRLTPRLHWNSQLFSGPRYSKHLPWQEQINFYLTINHCLFIRGVQGEKGEREYGKEGLRCSFQLAGLFPNPCKAGSQKFRQVFPKGSGDSGTQSPPLPCRVCINRNPNWGSNSGTVIWDTGVVIGQIPASTYTVQANDFQERQCISIDESKSGEGRQLEGRVLSWKRSSQYYKSNFAFGKYTHVPTLLNRSYKDATESSLAGHELRLKNALCLRKADLFTKI